MNNVKVVTTIVDEIVKRMGEIQELAEMLPAIANVSAGPLFYHIQVSGREDIQMLSDCLDTDIEISDHTPTSKMWEFDYKGINFWKVVIDEKEEAEDGE